MISKEVKAFRDEDFDSNTDPKTIEYHVGEKFDEAGLPNPYIEDHDQVDKDNDDRDGRGLPTNFAVQAQPNSTNVKVNEPAKSTVAKMA